ncbi:MAG: fluoride efflux transporter FluC, partial [Acidimicrobiales bacterium]
MAAVAAGGLVGGPARYQLGLLWPTRPEAFPVTTLVVNVSGSVVLAVLVVVVSERWPMSSYIRPFLGTGALGAYTTWSTFAVDTDLLAHHGRPAVAAAYAGVSLAAGLGGAALGIGAGRRLAGTPHGPAGGAG